VFFVYTDCQFRVIDALCLLIALLTYASLIISIYLPYFYLGKFLIKDEAKQQLYKINNRFFNLSITCFIFGIISVFIFFIPNIIKTKVDAEYTVCSCNCKNIGESLHVYQRHHQGNYPDKLINLIPTYIDKIPSCPAAKKDTYSSSYTVFNSTENNMHEYTFYCNGGNHKMIVSGNFPKYNSKSGLAGK
jgi:competence protein ComGC